MTGRTLVAGVGNIFLGDDGFGVEVARALAGRELPPGVEVADFGIRGVHLAYQLLDGYDLLVLVDALPRGEPPGTLSVLEPALPPADRGADETSALLDAHGMGPDAVLALLGMLAAADGSAPAVRRVLVVGCEPSQVEDGIGLSGPVQAVVDRAADVVLELVRGGGETSDQVADRGVRPGRGGGGDRRRPGHGPLLPDPADVGSGRA